MKITPFKAVSQMGGGKEVGKNGTIEMDHRQKEGNKSGIWGCIMIVHQTAREMWKKKIVSYKGEGQEEEKCEGT